MVITIINIDNNHFFLKSLKYDAADLIIASLL